MKLKLIPVCASVVLAASAILANGIKGNNTGAEQNDENISTKVQISSKNVPADVSNTQKEIYNCSNRILKESIAPDKSTKNDVFYMMLNSIDYFDKASGKMMFKSYNSEYIDTVEFQTIISEVESYSEYKSYKSKESLELNQPEVVNKQYCNKDKFMILYPNTKEYLDKPEWIVSWSDVCSIPDSDRVSFIDNVPCYNYRSNPLNVTMSNMCLFPQEFAFGFLENQDNWEISGIVDVSGNECYLIKGTLSPDYGSKFNVTYFEFMVSTKNGALVRYEGFDENNKITNYMYTDNLKFDSESEEIKEYSENIISEYSKIN